MASHPRWLAGQSLAHTLVLLACCAMNVHANSTHAHVEVHIGDEKHALFVNRQASKEAGHLEEQALAFLHQHSVTDPHGSVQELVSRMRHALAIQGPHSALLRPLCLNNSVFANVLLVVVYSTTQLGSIPLLHRLYGSAFPRMQFVVVGFEAHALEVQSSIDAAVQTSPTLLHNISSCLVPTTMGIPEDVGTGVLFYECLAAVTRAERRTYEGFMLIHDDLILNFWNLRYFDRSKVWLPHSYSYHSVHTHPSRWWWQHSVVGMPAVRNAWSQLGTDALAALGSVTPEPNQVIGGYSDVLYVPTPLASRFAQLSAVFARNKVWVEIAVPTIVGVLVGEEIFAESTYKSGSENSDSEARASSMMRDNLSAVHGAQRVLSRTGFPVPDDLSLVHSRVVHLDGSRLWLTDRSVHTVWNQYYTTTIDYIHPVKLSDDKHVEQLLLHVQSEADAWTRCA